MSTVKANTYQDASGGSNAVFSGVASPPNSMGFRNRVINGNMSIDQRNAGASLTPTTSGSWYATDRFAIQVSQNSKLTAQQNAGAVTPPAGYSNYLGFTSSSAYAVTSSDYFVFQQRIEGLNTSDLAFGTSSASAITVSFWVRSSLTGTFGGSVQNSSGNRCYVFSYTINSANTWEQKTVTIAGDTTGTWLTNNGIGLNIYWSLGSGSSNSGTAGSWGTSSLLSATGAVSVVGTNGATFYITGVQLEAGTVASPFERRDYGRELIMCQRYYWRATGANDAAIGSGFSGSTTTATVYVKLPVAMRAVPSVTAVTMVITDGVNYNAAITSVSSVVGGVDAVRVNVTCSGGGMTQYRPALMTQFGSGSSYTDFSSEL